MDCLSVSTFLKKPNSHSPQEPSMVNEFLGMDGSSWAPSSHILGFCLAWSYTGIVHMTQVALSSHVQDHCHLWQIWLFCICKRLHFISSIFALHFEVNNSAPWWTCEWPHLTNTHTTQTYKWIIPGRRKGATQYIYQGELYLGVHECIKIVSENQTPDTPDWGKGSYLDPIKRWIPNTVMSRAPPTCHLTTQYVCQGTNRQRITKLGLVIVVGISYSNCCLSFFCFTHWTYHLVIQSVTWNWFWLHSATPHLCTGITMQLHWNP